MKKGLVVYRSKYGAAKRYAELLQQETGCDVLALPDFRGPEAAGRDWVVFAAGIYAGGLGGVKEFQARYRPAPGQTLAVLAVGASPFDEQAVAQLRARSRKDSLAGAALFYARGAWDLSRMGLKDRAMCKLLLNSVKKRPPETLEPWTAALLEAGDSACDWTDAAFLTPLLDFLAP